jgi:hypothetical protein
MGDVWTEIGDAWDQLLGSLIATLQKRNPALATQRGRHSNDVFPFRGWASFFLHGTAGDEDLVISLDISRKADGFHAQADISRGDGAVIAESPVAVIAPGEEAALRAQALAAWAQIEAFLTANEELLALELAAD